MAFTPPCLTAAIPIRGGWADCVNAKKRAESLHIKNKAGSMYLGKFPATGCHFFQYRFKVGRFTIYRFSLLYLLSPYTLKLRLCIGKIHRPFLISVPVSFPCPDFFLRMILPRPGKKGGARQERDRNGTLKSNRWDGTLGIAEESPQQGEDLQRKARPEGERPKEKSTYIPYI